MRSALIFFAACCFVPAPAAEKTDSWQPTVWHGERALISTAPGWKAIVSLARGRLVHFGPAAGGTNLLFATASRDNPAGWGGHRLWLGPQRSWSKIWPPPDAWEHSGAESFTITDGTLRLVLPDAGDGWPRLTRTYAWSGAQLLCGAELSGGTRSAQFIQIIQIPQAARVEVVPQPSETVPHGYVQLPAGPIARQTTNFTPPPHATIHGTGLTLRHVGRVQKLGFNPQPLTAHEPALTLTVGRNAQHGTTAGEPDAGFSTQVYLGGDEPFIELEQLSPAFSAGTSATFVISLEGAAP